MSYRITSPVSVTNSVPVIFNLSNTSSIENWLISTNLSDQLNFGSTSTPSILTLNPNGDIKLLNVINSVIDSTTNTVVADKLRSSTTTITIGGAIAPNIGQTLIATSSTSASWQNIPDDSSNGNTLYIDLNAGNDSNSGEVTHQVLTIGQATILLAAKPNITFSDRGLLVMSSGLFPNGTTWNILPNVTYNGAGVNFTRTDSTGTVQLDPSA